MELKNIRKKLLSLEQFYKYNKNRCVHLSFKSKIIGNF